MTAYEMRFSDWSSDVCSSDLNGKVIGASAIALLAVLTAPALAQETPQGDASGQAETGLQDIVVTAQKRAENVQSVPVAITAVSGDMLTAKGISDVASLAGQAPNVTLRSTAQFGGSSSVLISYIRGIGQNDFAFNLEPGVGVYIDRKSTRLKPS